jgi:ribosome-binding factor A
MVLWLYDFSMSKRTNMLASVIRRNIAPVLRECPAVCGIVSITEVEVSTDFSIATVYISALEEPRRALKFLEGRRTVLQRQLSALERSHIPLLRFRIDRRTERGRRIDELLDNNLL